MKFDFVNIKVMKNLMIILLSIILLGNLNNINFEFVNKTKNFIDKIDWTPKKQDRDGSSLSEKSSNDESENSNQEYYFRNFSFNKEFKGKKYRFHYKLKFKIDDYKFYHQISKDEELNYYTKEFSNHEYLDDLVSQLEADAMELNLSRIELAELTTAFVQNCITYKVSQSKFPIESLIEGQADCKGKSVILAKLLQKQGFGTKLLLFPTHMMPAILISEDANYKYYDLKDGRYTIIESTQPGWQIGQFPSGIDATEGTLDVF